MARSYRVLPRVAAGLGLGLGLSSQLPHHGGAQAEPADLAFLGTAAVAGAMVAVAAGAASASSSSTTSSIVDAVGNTPLVELKSLSRATGCRILAKAEYMNPGGECLPPPAPPLTSPAAALTCHHVGRLHQGPGSAMADPRRREVGPAASGRNDLRRYRRQHRDRPCHVNKNDEFCIENEEYCIKNEELCITNEELCTKK